MKTSAKADSFTPSLLDQLREKSAVLRARGEAARKPMEEALKEIDRTLWRTFRWLDEALGHLGVIRPCVNHVFHLGTVLAIERPRFDRGFVSFRRRALAGLEVLEHVEMFYRLEGSKAIALRMNPMASLAVEERLRGSTLPYQYQTEQDEKRVVRYGLFQVQPHISASARFEADYHHQLIQVTLRNVDRFESVSLDFPPDKLVEAALEDLVKLMMGEPNGFLRRAPLALIRGSQDAVTPAPQKA
ncbi:MAG TPA: hypothetical protein VMN56_02110 [Casimicrobiaceae bacterium]|nr:hypothetical protein [Casimicrobiaceae bacterium]